MSEIQEAPSSPVYCCYCGNVYPPADQGRTSGTITCETCGRTQYVNGRPTQRQHTAEVICPNRKCGEWTTVNKLQRAGKTKTSCHVCREQISIETDGLGRLTDISLVKRGKTLTTKQWLYVATSTLFLGLMVGCFFLGWFYYGSATPAPVSANEAARSGSRVDLTGGGGGRSTQSTEPLPSPTADNPITGGQPQ